VNTPPTTIDDTQLLARVGQRDRQAFSQLYNRYAAILYSTILRVVTHPDDASEVLQDVFLQIWQAAARYDPALDKPFSWALDLARHRAIERLRSLKHPYRFIEEVTHEMEEEAFPRSVRPGEVFPPHQAAFIRSAIATLPLEQRQAIEMAFLGGLTQNEIAADLNQPLATIKTRIRRGMLKLRDSLRSIV
jgi:RNA polymerase sigma-70 factor (ECF subfamily)